MPQGPHPDRPDHTGPRSRASGGEPGRAHGSDEESRKALAFVARLATEFVAVTSLPDLLDHILRLLHEEMEMTSCAIALIDDRDPDLLAIRATSGLQAAARGQAFRRGRGLGWTAIESGQPLIIPDLQADRRALFQVPGRRSGIIAPLFAHGKPIGVVSAYSAEVGALTQSDLNLLTIIASYLAGAIEVARLHEQMKELASIDALTGLTNRRVFLDRLHAEIDRSRRTEQPLSVALLDLDRFKQINDTYGHASGDEMLTRIAGMIRGSIRGYDLAGRFGGDEFTILFPETARPQAEDILSRLPDFEFVPKHGGPPLSVGCSWGIAVLPEDGEDEDRLLQVADQRLYEMKKRRRGGPPPGNHLQSGTSRLGPGTSPSQPDA